MTTATAPAIAIAAADVRRLVRETPERVLWAPGRSVWGLALVAGSNNAILCVDGCLLVAHTIWPSHYIPGGAYHLDGVVRALSGTMRVGRLADQSIFACRLPDTVVGACCVVVAQTDLPWLPQDHEIMPAEDLVWTAPRDPRASAALLPIHPWQTMAALRAAPTSAAVYLAAIGEPPEMVVLPNQLRIERLVAYWRLHLQHERGRLEVMEHPLPAWIDDDGEIWRLAEAWVVSGWRGPGEPPEAVSPVAPAAGTVASPPASEPDLSGMANPWMPGGGAATNPWG